MEEIVEVGELEAENIHLPSIYVHRLIQGPAYEKRIERRTYAKKPVDTGLLLFLSLFLTLVSVAAEDFRR